MKTDQLIALMQQIQENFLISHNIVNRAYYPAYYGEGDIPELLTKFKQRLAFYREKAIGIAKELGQKHGPLFSQEIPYNFSDITTATFAQQLVVSLAVSELGLGECAECASRLAVEMIKAGEKSLAFVSVKFINTKKNTEQGHQFIIASLPNQPNPIPMTPNMSIFDLFKNIPPGANIVDPFLGLYFSPQQIPLDFQQYLSAYGGSANVIDCIHLFNFREKTLQPYVEIAKIIKSKLVVEIQKKEQAQDWLADKTPLEHETTIIRMLNAKSPQLRFFGVQDAAYKVDAIAYIENSKDEDNARKIQCLFKGYGLFFTPLGKKKVFVLEGINLPEGKPSIGERLQRYLT